MKKRMWIFIIGLLMILVLRYRDYFFYELQDGGYLEDYENSEEDSFQGMIASVGGLHLKKGDYLVTISATSWGSDNYFEIVDTQYSTGTEIQDKVLFTSKFEEGVTQNVYTITLQEPAKSVCIRSYQVNGELKLSGYQLRSEKPYYSDTIFLAILWCVLFFLACWKHSWLVTENGKIFIIICAVGIIVSLPLFTDFLAYGHDIVYHLQRVNGITKSLVLKDQMPVRVNTAINYGYGLVNPIMYPELFLYIPGILGACGVSLMISMKFLLILTNVATGLIGFYSISTIARKRTAFIFAMLYVMSPYRLNNLYARFALGEFMAMTFLPLLFVGIWQILHGDSKKWWMSAVGCTCILQSHLLTVEMCVFFSAILVLLNFKCLFEKTRFVQAAKAVVLTVLMNLWYLIPLIQFMGYHFDLLESQRDLSENGVYLLQMFSTIYTAEGDKVLGSTYHDMPLSVGVTLLLGIIIYVIYYYARLKEGSEIKKWCQSCLILGLISMYMASWLFPWQVVYRSQILAQIFGIIQFSWRFLVFVTLFFSIITSYVLDWCWDNKRIWCAVCGVCTIYSCIVLANGYMSENESTMRNKYDQSYENEMYDYFYKKAYSIWKLEDRLNIVTLDRETSFSIENYVQQGTRLTFDFKLEDEAGYIMSLPYYNYGFYKVELDGEELVTFSDDQELVAVRIPEGIKQGHIELYYSERKLYVLSDIVSLGTVAMIVVWIVYKNIYHIKTYKCENRISRADG